MDLDFDFLGNKGHCIQTWMDSMDKNQQITVLLMVSILVGACTKNMYVAPLVFVLLYMAYCKPQKLTKEMLQEGFHSDEMDASPQVQIPDKASLQKVFDNEFKEGTKSNPFSNVLLTQIMDDPDREAAPPAFNETVQHDINKEVKKAVQMLNPTILNTNKQLFGDLWQNFVLDQSNRVFYSTANTRVTNDQGAYAKFLYDNMKYSGKESTPEGAFARIQDNYRYTLY
jgi:hypothetical protein